MNPNCSSTAQSHPDAGAHTYSSASARTSGRTDHKRNLRFDIAGMNNVQSWFQTNAYIRFPGFASGFSIIQSGEAGRPEILLMCRMDMPHRLRKNQFPFQRHRLPFYMSHNRAAASPNGSRHILQLLPRFETPAPAVSAGPDLHVWQYICCRTDRRARRPRPDSCQVKEPCSA